MLKIKMTIGILNVNIFFSMILFNYCYDDPSIYDFIVIMINKQIIYMIIQRKEMYKKIHEITCKARLRCS